MVSTMVEAGQLERLLGQINAGGAAQALAELDGLLPQQPAHPGMLALRAEALRLLGRLPEAIDAYRQAAAQGGGSRNWLVAGVLLAEERKTDEAVGCLLKALAESPDDPQVLDPLITTLFNANRQREAADFARRQLLVATQPRFLSNAALLLQGIDCYEESCDAFKRILQLAPSDATLIGSALAAARFTCEWDWVEALQRQIGAYYEQGDFAAPEEYPLTHLTWCADEARNLAVTRSYVERRLPRVAPLARSAVRAGGQRLRVGYLSCDFRNHATMHLMAGLLESHDRRRFEIFAYDYSSHDISDYRQRFLDAVEHHVEIHSLSDQQAADRIAQDQLDILFDLKGYTGGCRPGILACRPALLQVAYLGFPGSTASEAIDYIVSDRFVTPDGSAPYYTEKFCRLPHSYQCNDRKRLTASEPGTRAMHGLPDDQVVFGAFNQCYKIDRGSFSVWLRILQQVPGSVLWVLGQNNAAIANLGRQAAAAGIEPHRLVFAPFAEPRAHLARLQLADAVLDTLVCNGHTTTSDALWAGVPVITARGTHFASRVSESLLNAMNLGELVGADHEDMIRIARRVAADSAYRDALRRQLAAGRLTCPLFDTARFTRNFETAIEMLVRQQRAGTARALIDVPDGGPLAPPADAGSHETSSPQLQATYEACPLCAARSVTLGFANCTASRGWRKPLPAVREWMRCPACGHVHTRHHWTPAGLMEILRGAPAIEPAQSSADAHARRAACAATVERIVGLLGGYGSVVGRSSRPVWVDAGCGDGALLMMAADYGFAAVGLDVRTESVQRLQGLGFTVLPQDFMKLKFEVVLDVLSMMDSLERIARPSEALAKAAQILRPGGVLVIGTPDLGSSGWRVMEAQNANPYWSEPTRYHLFGRDRLVALLNGSGFEVADFAAVLQPAAQMQLYAVRKP